MSDGGYSVWTDADWDDLWARLDPIILRGEHITAIKMYREEKNVSLRDAKQAIERRIDELVKPK